MSITRRTWKQEEDLALLDLIQKLGKRNWGAVAHTLHHELGYRQRSGKQCRQRWHNSLNPKIQKGKWTEQEQNLVFEMHSRFGNKWTTMAQRLPGRTDNAIKNFFYSTIRRSLRRISKLVGQKNNTLFVRGLKPITLSRIFASQSQFFDREAFQKREQIKNVCRFLKTQILNFTRISILSRQKKRQQKIEFDKNKMEEVLRQIVLVNKIFENNQFTQQQEANQSQDQSQLPNQAVKSQQQSVDYNCAIKKQWIPKQAIKRNEAKELTKMHDRVNEDNQLPFFPGLSFSDINFNLSPVHPYPYRINPYPKMDFYYSPILYFQPKLNSCSHLDYKDKQFVDKNDVSQRKIQSNQRLNTLNKTNSQLIYSAFNQGRLPSVKELIEGTANASRDKKIQLTADQCQTVIIDFMSILHQRLQEWRLN